MSYSKAAYGVQCIWQEKSLDTAWQKPDFEHHPPKMKTQVACCTLFPGKREKVSYLSS